MGRSLHALSVSLPPCPMHRATPEERAEQAALMDEFWQGMERRDRERERRAQHRALRPITDAQRRRRQAQARVLALRKLLPQAVEASRWARIVNALEGLDAWQADEAAARLRAKVTRATRWIQQRAAEGCTVCAAFLDDGSMRDLCRELAGEQVEDEAAAEQ